MTSGPVVQGQFPVTVDPARKIIIDDARVDALFATPLPSPHTTDPGARPLLMRVAVWVATALEATGLYHDMAALEGRSVTILPGMRKEQVASIFGKELGWSDAQTREFTTPVASSSLPLFEGSFSPGTYAIHTGMTPREAQSAVNARFKSDVLSHYGAAVSRHVPLDDALIIASLIERETLNGNDMRLVSGVIWNRLFNGMNLQIDATVQYAKANDKNVSRWWPSVLPRDIYRRSPYNTYQHPGLPPTPIASPSVAAILAALNPIKTSCLFYFNDKAGAILCSDTYDEHVARLKQEYGRGK
jgi:UPF0755 protein